MLALPPAAPPAPRRQLLVGAALVCFAATALLGGMLSLWMQFRRDAISAAATWVPDGIVIPEVVTNVMLIAFLPICVFAQWAVYSAKRDDRVHAGAALGLTGLLGLAVVNGQAFVYTDMGLPVSGGAYHSMFYALTGTFMLLVVAGIAFSVITAFHYLGGRWADREIVAAHALYWYFLSVAYAALWLVVYVTK